MKNQPWFVLFVLALAMLSCSVFTGADEQLSQDDAATVPEPTQDLRIESRQNSPTPKATMEDGSSGETPRPATDVPQADPTATLDLDEAPWLREFDIQFNLIEGEFDLELLDATVIKVYESIHVYGVVQNLSLIHI